MDATEVTRAVEAADVSPADGSLDAGGTAVDAAPGPVLTRRTPTETAAREDALVDAFVGLARGLVSVVDASEVLRQLVDGCVGLFDSVSAGVLLTDDRGGPAVAASSSAERQVLGSLEVQAHQGPCLDCVRLAEPVQVADLAQARGRWPAWAPAALAAGVRSAYAFPLRLGDTVVGALGFFGSRVDPVDERDRRIAQALADVATITVLTARRVGRAEERTGQLQTALDSRVVIEQAKGVVAAALGMSVDDAFGVLRTHSRSANRRLAEVAADVTTGRLAPDRLGRRQRR